MKNPNTKRDKAGDRKIAVIDLETDPFLWGRKPEAFAAGFYDGEQYAEFWGCDCVHLLLEYLSSLETDYLIYAHNGGKFDFYYLLEHGAIENPIRVIGGRIVSAKLGRHELRDSYAILPIPLSAYEKEKVDYATFEKEVRDTHRSDILHYLSKDCEYLFELVFAFLNRFGPKLTIGGAAMAEIKKHHPFEPLRARHDELFRPYYYGGRVQCFAAGINHGAYKVYDVNGMYPHVMRDFEHPRGRDYYHITKCKPDDIQADGMYKKYPDYPYFMTFTGTNKNALPIRTKSGLDFSCTEGEFSSCSHEIKIALKYGLITIDKITEIIVFPETQNFATFVDLYSSEKASAKLRGDKAGYIFAKLIQNSGYGKYGQNPDNYFDYFLRYPDEPTPPDNYDLYLDYGGIEIWREKSNSIIYYDVSVAASITSAARAVLLEALQTANGAMYCDTDSIICESLSGVEFDPVKLGAWDLEAEGDTLAVAGKKLYALTKNGECVKSASKGVRLEHHEIIKIARGDEHHYRHDAPNFKLSGAVKFTDRNIRATNNC